MLRDFNAVLFLFRAVAVGDDTNDHPSSSIEEKTERTSAYRRTTPTSMPRSDARFRDAASKLSSPVKKSAMVEVTAAAVTEASVEVTVKAEEEARTFFTSFSSSSSSSSLGEGGGVGGQRRFS